MKEFLEKNRSFNPTLGLLELYYLQSSFNFQFISIPLWDYWNKIKFHKNHGSTKRVSIPLWDYWSKSRERKKDKGIFSFNPPLGLLKLLPKLSLKENKEGFNPPLGLLKQDKVIGQLGFLKSFNPPLGLLELTIFA